MRVIDAYRRPVHERPFPPGATPFVPGGDEGEGTPVFIERDVAKRVATEAARAARASQETLALLVGDRFTEPATGAPFSVATDRVTAPLLSTPHHVRFDGAKVAELAAALDAVPYDYLIVGWFHSHLGQGCHPSAVDQATHRRYFSAPHQFAMILDARSTEAGAFGLERGGMVRRPLRVFERGAIPSRREDNRPG